MYSFTIIFFVIKWILIMLKKNNFLWCGVPCLFVANKTMDISPPLLDPEQELSEFKLNKYFDIRDIPTKASVNDIIHSDFVLFKTPVRTYLDNVNNSSIGEIIWFKELSDYILGFSIDYLYDLD